MRRVFRAYRAAFSGLPREVWLLAFALLVNRSGSMVLPFLGLYATQARHLPPTSVAWVLVAYGLGAIVGSWSGGTLCHRFGAVRVQQASLVMSGLAYLAIPLAPADPRALGAVVFASSMVADAFRPALMSAVADAAPDAVRMRAIALVRLAANLGFAVGPSVGGVLASIDYNLIFVADALTSWLAAVVLWRWATPRRAHAADAGAVPAAPRASAVRDRGFLGLLALVFVLTLALFQTFSTLPLYLHRAYGLNERTIGLVLGWNGALIVMFEMVLVHRVERMNRLRVVAGGMLLLCGGFALLPLGRSAPFAVAVMSVVTFGEMLSLPLTNALAADRGGEGARGAYMGLYSAAFAAAFVVAPAAGMFLFERYGGTTLWLGAGALGPVLACGAFALERVFHRPHPRAT